MNRMLLVTTAIVACAACAPEPLAPVRTAAAPPAPAAPTLASPTSAQAPGTRGSIGGTVATNPYHAVKVGGVVYLEDGPRDSGTPLSATLDNHDMAFVPSIVVLPAGGTTIEGCYLDLPGIGSVSVSLEVRHIDQAARDGGARRCGCEFVDLSPQARLMLQRYVNRIEADQRRAAGAPGRRVA